jgi:hypothetical protein
MLRAEIPITIVNKLFNSQSMNRRAISLEKVGDHMRIPAVVLYVRIHVLIFTRRENCPCRPTI